MTREQAINYLFSSGFTNEQVGDVVRALTYEPTTKNDSSGLDKNSKKLEKGTTKNDLGVDLISRNEVLNRLASIAKIKAKSDAQKSLMGRCMFMVERMPSVTPQEQKKGEWLRMSGLSDQEDDRYKCSRCGNVVHYKSKMGLYTFNGWCGRCGSNNER